MPSLYYLILLHQLDALPGKSDGTRGTVMTAGMLFQGVAHQTLYPSNRQQQRTLFHISVLMRHVIPVREHGCQYAAFFTVAAGFHGVQCSCGGVEACVVVGAVNTAAKGVVQHGFHINASIPRCGKVERNA